MDSAPGSQQSIARPTPQSCQLIDFESADVLRDSPLGYPAVIVQGEKPYAAMTASLQPLVYIRQPEYWGYEVVGCLPDEIAVPDVTGPYAVVLPLAGASLGTKGVEIVGTSNVHRIDIDPESLDDGGSH